MTSSLYERLLSYPPRDESAEATLGTPGTDCGFMPWEIEEAPEAETIDWDDEPPTPMGVTGGPLGAAHNLKEFDHIARALRREGLRVKVVKGWQTRGRAGLWAPRGVLNHHTASNRRSGNAASLGIVTHGRSDLPGPLANFLPARDGTIYIVAAGRCNHAGEGGPWRGVPKDSGNAYLMGLEFENDGIGEPWPDKQHRAGVILNAVLLDRMNETAYMAGDHREYAKGRKIDRTGVNSARFRKQVRQKMNEIRSTGVNSARFRKQVRQKMNEIRRKR